LAPVKWEYTNSWTLLEIMHQMLLEDVN